MNHMPAYGGQSSEVDKNVFAHLIWINSISKDSNHVIIENARIFWSVF